MTLQELVTRFTPRITLVTLGLPQDYQLCKSDSARWALAFATDTAGGGNERLFLPPNRNSYFTIGSWGSPVTFIQKDWPGFAQQEWWVDPNGSMATIYVIECLQLPSP